MIFRRPRGRLCGFLHDETDRARPHFACLDADCIRVGRLAASPRVRFRLGFVAPVHEADGDNAHQATVARALFLGEVASDAEESFLSRVPAEDVQCTLGVRTDIEASPNGGKVAFLLPAPVQFQLVHFIETPSVW